MLSGPSSFSKYHHYGLHAIELVSPFLSVLMDHVKKDLQGHGEAAIREMSSV